MNRNWKDGLNYASKLSPLRFWNMLQLVGSYYLSKALKRPIHYGMPTSISLEPTTSCNLRCPECPSGLRQFSRPTGMLNDKVYEQVIDELAPRLTYLIFYFQGEPYLNPKFLEHVAYANKRKIYTATSTNAHYLNDDVARKTVDSGLDRLIISIDGTTQDVYEQYRKGGKLAKVIEGTKNVVKWKKELKSKTPHIIFQYLVVKPNEHQLEDVKKLADELGVDEVAFKTAQIYDYEDGSELIPTIEKYSRYKQLKSGKWAIKNRLVNHCWKMWHSCVITWDGKVVPCCFDKDAHHQLGEMSETSFKAVWKGSSYRNFRQALIRSRSEIEICKNCSEGTKVWA
ncbi:SPASM domain-containing protein [Roseivirga pacifica]|uniref:SPASM domain-containing protein n=1 Tax=Roseivirga pacifica TaxID=1267423 RepID=UPI0020943C06|nr:radical SAM protein [Roseivirga pacifica]MCO6358946.1 radical SAM protein [Roseivirga pacifica]MCO6365418.1 radical SAM protein [Roseivirga pacifica]MCO6371852.1 radical SAM protein [Roseivirga pacifica]MCO6376037.1 radical SAM protein [Roseivirga pacifica]MCO6379230.1 radical SAM protein [Roseivirga pacifica]